MFGRIPFALSKCVVENELIVVPAVDFKEGQTLDEWFESRRKVPFLVLEPARGLAALRNAPLQGTDRLWIERVERQGDRITVAVQRADDLGIEMHEHWRAVCGLNLGKLPAGDYRVEFTIESFGFTELNDKGVPQRLAQRDLHIAPKRLELVFAVAACPRARTRRACSPCPTCSARSRRRRFRPSPTAKTWIKVSVRLFSPCAGGCVRAAGRLQGVLLQAMNDPGVGPSGAACAAGFLLDLDNDERVSSAVTPRRQQRALRRRGDPDALVPRQPRRQGPVGRCRDHPCDRKRHVQRERSGGGRVEGG